MPTVDTVVVKGRQLIATVPATFPPNVFVFFPSAALRTPTYKGYVELLRRNQAGLALHFRGKSLWFQGVAFRQSEVFNLPVNDVWDVVFWSRISGATIRVDW